MLMTNKNLGLLASMLWWGEHSGTLWELSAFRSMFWLFSHQIYTLLFATGSLECDNVCNLRAAETGLDESPDAAGISILKKTGHLGRKWNKTT